MQEVQIIEDYKKLMKFYYPNLCKLSNDVSRAKFKAYKKSKFPQVKLTSLNLNSFRMLTQPNEAWTKEQLNEAQKVVDYLKRTNVKRVSEHTSYVYKKPLYWGR
jgi:hypothetical protein